MPESNQKKLDRVRKPRVHITYDVEIGDAVVKKELPFVMGVLGDFSGNPTEPLKKLTDRKFVSIDRDNFNDVLASMTPGLSMRVENALAGDGSEMAVNLEFKSMADFDPGKIVEQVAPLKKLQEARDQLRDLLTNMDKSDDLESELEEILKNTEKAQELAGELGLDASGGSDSEGGE